VIREPLDGVVEAADRLFAEAFEIEIAFDEVGERAGQEHRSAQLFGEGFETRGHVDCGTASRLRSDRINGARQSAHLHWVVGGLPNVRHDNSRAVAPL
jgi:hypothetical protein